MKYVGNSKMNENLFPRCSIILIVSQNMQDGIASIWRPVRGLQPHSKLMPKNRRQIRIVFKLSVACVQELN